MAETAVRYLSAERFPSAVHIPTVPERAHRGGACRSPLGQLNLAEASAGCKPILGWMLA